MSILSTLLLLFLDVIFFFDVLAFDVLDFFLVVPVFGPFFFVAIYKTPLSNMLYKRV